ASALEQLAVLTGRPSEGVVGIERDDDQWVVEIEVLELRRIPNTTDVLARYRVTADDTGELTGYRRMQRYTRGAAGEE
ncbi:MAG TPA: gas vesicle protein, partial [Nocardioides sp.]|nr:gas vesicle protein [Nocardioides sp.]